MEETNQTHGGAEPALFGWLVFMGAALGDEFPGKDFDATAISATDQELDVCIENTLLRESEDIETNVWSFQEREAALGRSGGAPQMVAGLRVFVVEATSFEALCLKSDYSTPRRMVFSSSWPANPGTPQRIVEAGAGVLLRKQLRMLLEEGRHRGDDAGARTAG